MRPHAILHQTAEELRMTIERGETLLVTFGIPIILLCFFAEVPVISTGTSSRIAFIAPGIFALAVMSSSMVSLGIATGFERSYGVLRRIGVTPLGRRALIVAKISAVVVLEVVQVLVLGAISIGLGWRIGSGTGAAVGALLLASVAFSGLGLLFAGTLRAEATLAAANGLYVIFLLIGGILFPLDRLGAFGTFAKILPAGALTDLVHPLLAGSTASISAWLALSAWAVAAPVAAALLFRFD